jgi:glucosamine kinase
VTQQLFIGVDGGATKVIVRIENEHGSLLERDQGGVSNIRISVENTWHSIHSTLDKILRRLGITLPSKHYQVHVGMGLAGCELSSAYQAFLNYPHPFDTLVVTSDAHVACLGAHGGEDGGTIVIGTGVVGFQLDNNQITKVSGFGFPHDDEGGGASIGLDALKLTFKSIDRRRPETRLSKTIFAYFGEDLDRLVTFANQANSTEIAQLAPLVIECAKAGDESARALLQNSAQAILEIAYTLLQSSENSLPLSLVGGLAPFIQPYLGDQLGKHLRPSKMTPDQGAILLVRHHLLTVTHENARGENVRG